MARGAARQAAAGVGAKQARKQEQLEEQEQRTALGRLQGQGRHGAKVGSIRVGAVKLGGPGTLPPSGGLGFKQPLKPNNHAPIQIFQDDSATSRNPGLARVATAPSSTIPSRQDHKENELSAVKWSQAKGPKQVNIPLDKIGQYAAKPGFTFHEDQGPEVCARRGCDALPGRPV